MSLVDMFNAVQGKKHWPRIIFPHQDGNIVFSLASKSADPHFENLIYIKFKSEHQGDYYLGAISKKNELNLYIRNAPPCDVSLLLATIKTLHEKPLESFKILGQSFSFCCFCGTEITSKDSLAVGYGPVCAENYGLPWGQIPTCENIGDL